MHLLILLFTPERTHFNSRKIHTRLIWVLEVKGYTNSYHFDEKLSYIKENI